MNFEVIDNFLNAFAKKHSINMQTVYKESTVRSFDIVSKNGVRYQLWIDSIEDDEVTIKAWDYKKRSLEITGKAPETHQLLERAYLRVKEWIENENQK